MRNKRHRNTFKKRTSARYRTRMKMRKQSQIIDNGIDLKKNDDFDQNDIKNKFTEKIVQRTNLLKVKSGFKNKPKFLEIPNSDYILDFQKNHQKPKIQEIKIIELSQSSESFEDPPSFEN